MRSAREFNLELVRRYLRWMVIQHYAISTQRMYSQVLKSYCQFLRNRPIPDATHETIMQYLSDLAARGLALITIHQKLDSLRVFYDFLRIGGFQTQAPARLFHLRPVRRQIPRILSEQDVEKLIAHSRNPRDRAFIELLYSTGCRGRELTEVRLENIDFDNRTIRVVGKGKTRIVLFGRQAEKAIHDYLGKRREGYLFTPDVPAQWGSVYQHRRSWHGSWMDYGVDSGKPRVKRMTLGRVDSMSFWEAKRQLASVLRHEHIIRPDRDHPLCPVSLQLAVSTVSRLAGLGHVTPRMLRHTFATHLLDRGADIGTIQELMGHAWIQTTQIYTQVSRQKLVRTFRECHPRGA